MVSAHPARLPRRWLLAGLGLTAAIALIAVSIGPVGIAPGRALLELVDRIPGVGVTSGLSGRHAAILVDIRLPRVVTTILVGSVLATAGGAYQGVFRNDLADPYLLGIAAGAGLGVTIATIAGATLGWTPVAAFSGAISAAAATYLLGGNRSRHGGHGNSRATLILAGVAVAALAGAVQTFLLQRDDEAIRDVYAWLLGRFNTAGWDDAGLLAPYAVLSVGGLLLLAHRLDVMAVGDVEAAALGVDARRTRLAVVAIASLGTAAAVAVSGLIGFVGIVVPHAVRLVAGPVYRRILPLAAVLGGAFLCIADLAARTVLSPAEIPVGVVTAIVGAPFFLAVMRRSRTVGV